VSVAYGVPGAAVWAAVGGALNLLDATAVALSVVMCYSVAYGAMEWFRIPGLSAPGRTWQVPQGLVKGTQRSRRLVVWGLLLGPGFLTRNPYAGFGFLVLAVATPANVGKGVLVGAAIGGGHGVARGAALIRDARRAADVDFMNAARASLQWRAVDGFVLLVGSGLAGGTLLQLVA
jgi:hypothetical protein